MAKHLPLIPVVAIRVKSYRKFATSDEQAGEGESERAGSKTGPEVVVYHMAVLAELERELQRPPFLTTTQLGKHSHLTSSCNNQAEGQEDNISRCALSTVSYPPGSPNQILLTGLPRCLNAHPFTPRLLDPTSSPTESPEAPRF